MGNCLNIHKLNEPKIEIQLDEEIVSTIKDFNSIKSLYIKKEIFSFLNIKQKLEIIIYNKQIQGEFGIDIKNYKNISGKYKIGGKNGKVSEYILNTNILLFEGEYIKGKRDGKGKEYFDHILLFEGEYIKGKRGGKDKEYYDNGKIKFEGEYLNGERDGKVKNIMIMKK